MPQEKKNPRCKNFILIAKILFPALHKRADRARPKIFYFSCRRQADIIGAAALRYIHDEPFAHRMPAGRVAQSGSANP